MGWAFGLVVGFLVLVLLTSLGVLVRAAFLHDDNQQHAHKEAIAKLALEVGGSLTHDLVVQHLDISRTRADRILRSMVDDKHFKMAVDEEASCLVFWYPELTGTAVPGHISRYSRVRRPVTGDLYPT